MSLLGIFIYPVCLCMCMPVFIYQIVLEKETRLLESMKINGMKMKNYWIVNFFFNLGFYSITILLFLFFGISVLKLKFFESTNLMLMFIIFFGWGLA